MGLGELLLNPERAKLFSLQIKADSERLSKLSGIEPAFGEFILRETAILLETDEPNHIQLKRIQEAGLTSEDIDYEPSIFEAIEQIGVNEAKMLFQASFKNLITAWSVQKSLEFPPPFLISTEWQENLGHLKDHFQKHAESIRQQGLAPTHIPVSTLLRFLPRGCIARIDDIAAIGAELDGKSKEQILEKIETPSLEDHDEYNDLVPPLRKLLLTYYQDVFEILGSLKKGVEIAGLPRALATSTYRIFKSWSNLEELSRIETYLLRQLSGEYGDEFAEDEIDDLMEQNVFSDLDRPVSIPLQLQDILQFSFFIAYENEEHSFSELRSDLLKEMTFTEFGYPVLSYDFWQELKASAPDLFKKSEMIHTCLKGTEKQYEKFVAEYIDELRRLFSLEIKLYVNSLELTEKTDSSIRDIVNLLKGANEAALKPYYVRDSEYIFENNFTILKWRDQSWEFKKWEGRILEAFYYAYQGGTLDLTAEQIHSMAVEAHYKDVSKNPNKPKKMFHSVFQGHELNQKFIISAPIKGFYRLNPEWTPKNSKTRSKEEQKDYLSKRIIR